jgi:hypothetical protein
MGLNRIYALEPKHRVRLETVLPPSFGKEEK